MSEIVTMIRLNGPLPADVTARWYEEDAKHGVFLLEPRFREAHVYWGDSNHYMRAWEDRMNDLDPAFDLRLVWTNKNMIVGGESEDGFGFAIYEYRREPFGDWVRVSGPPVREQIEGEETTF